MHIRLNDYYPLNQDGSPPEMFVYVNTLTWLAGWVKQRSSEGLGTQEEIIAQVEKDLRRMLDQDLQPM
jgi:hypothetical protein